MNSSLCVVDSLYVVCWTHRKVGLTSRFIFYCSIHVVGVYHIDPNGGHPVDSLQVMCDFDESCSTCIDPNEMVREKKTTLDITRDISPHLPSNFHSLQFHYSSSMLQGSHSKSCQTSQERVYVGWDCTKLAAVICPAALSFFSMSSGLLLVHLWDQHGSAQDVADDKQAGGTEDYHSV